MRFNPTMNGINAKLAALGFAIVIMLATEFAYSSELPNNILDKITYNSPELSEEKAHEMALERSEAGSRAKTLPHIDVNLVEDYVRGDTDSGFLSLMQLKVPIFEKGQSALLLKIAQLERESYAALRNSSLAERLYRFRIAYYEASGILALLPDLATKKKLLIKLIKRQKKLLKERLKDSEDFDHFYNDLLSVDEEIEYAKASFGAAKAILLYLSNSVNMNDLFIEVSDEPSSLDIIRKIERLKTDAVASHPEAVKLRIELDKQRINSRIVSMENLPEISGISSYVHDPRFNGNENQLFGGVEARWNVWDFGANKHSVEREEALSNELEARIGSAGSRRLFTIDDAIRFYEASYKVWKNYKGYSVLRQKILASVKRRYSKGEASWKKLTLERIKYIDCKMTSEKAREDVFKKEAGLIFALGRLNI